MNEELIRKLHPSRFPHMTPKMVAIMGFLLDQEWTAPKITDLMITSDGFVLAQNEGDVGYNYFICAFTDLNRNFESLLNYPDVQLETVEKNQLWFLFTNKIRKVGYEQTYKVVH